MDRLDLFKLFRVFKYVQSKHNYYLEVDQLKQAQWYSAALTFLHSRFDGTEELS